MMLSLVWELGHICMQNEDEYLISRCRSRQLAFEYRYFYKYENIVVNNSYHRDL